MVNATNCRSKFFLHVNKKNLRIGLHATIDCSTSQILNFKFVHIKSHIHYYFLEDHSTNYRFMISAINGKDRAKNLNKISKL